MANGNFCVVAFRDSQDLATVPSPWISEELCGLACAFPPGHLRHARQLAKINAAVETSWPKFPCEILHTFDTFENAIKKERFLESYSDFGESHEHEHKLRKRQRRNYSSSEDERERSPPPPIVITDVVGSTSAVALPDVSSSVSPDEHREKHSTDQNSHDLDITERLERLEKCCFTIQNDVRQILDLLQSQRDSHVATLESLDVVENYLPLSSLPALYELESHLVDSLERREELRVHLQQLGGSSPDEMVKRILRHLFTDDLAQQFSWMGQKGKNKLCDLLLMKVIFHAVETSKIKGTREHVLKKIKDWFRHAGARNKYVIERSLSRVLCS